MSLKSYYINAQAMPENAREELFTKLDNSSFITAIDLNNTGCIQVYWDSKENICDVITFPPECIVTTN